MKHALPVSRPRPANTLRRLPAALTILALAGSSALIAAPVQAKTADGAASTTGCIHPAQRATTWREGADTSEVGARVRAKVERIATSATAGSSARAAGLPGSVRVPVIIHVIHGRHRGEHRINKRKARQLFYILKAGFAGAQDATMTPTGVNFKLRKVTISRNEGWFHAAPFSRADRQMKNRLHRGGAQVLNIYVNRPRSHGQLLLGFSLFPWQRKAHKRLDGVTISEVSLPGGRAGGYNLGDTVIHETGHWMGLLHPFEGGCNDGDGVADTPAEAGPNFVCVEGTNTCNTPIFQDPANPAGPLIDLPDPIHNFMDYSYDYCMNQFTPGQRERMFALFMHYRFGR